MGARGNQNVFPVLHTILPYTYIHICGSDQLQITIWNQLRWFGPEIPTLKLLRQEDQYQLEVCLGLR